MLLGHSTVRDIKHGRIQTNGEAIPASTGPAWLSVLVPIKFRSFLATVQESLASRNRVASIKHCCIRIARYKRLVIASKGYSE